MFQNGKLGFWGLTALVFGMVIGVGIFNLPQNMAASASQGAILLSWLITGAGILPLMISFNYLSNTYPQYNAGIYQYAQAGFGNYAGFNIAWGYWLCSAFSNVAFGVMLNDSVGAFFPVLLTHGWPTVIFCSTLIWVMFGVVARGIRLAEMLTSLLALVKVVMLVLIISILIIFFNLEQFEFDPWGELTCGTSVWEQVKSTMMITLFCFLGVEGAVMMAARAKKKSDIGKAGFAGFSISLLLYIAVSLLCFGIMTGSQLKELHNPSIAYILKDVVGQWAYWLVITAIIISLLGGWVAWTLVVAQVPYEASLVGIMPRRFSRLNRRGMPAFGLMASSIAMELFLLLVVMADDLYLAALHITGLMITPCYFFTGLFLLKVGRGSKIKAVALITTLFCLWMAYAGGLIDLVMTSPFYLTGIFFYIRTRREHNDSTLFTRNEKLTIALLCTCAVFTLFNLKYLL